MLKKLLSFVTAVNFICAAPLCAQSNGAAYTQEDIQIKLRKPKTILAQNGLPCQLPDLSLAIAAGYSLNANTDIISRIKAFIGDITLERNNPPAALAKRSEQLTRSFNKAVKGKANYSALSRDINLLNKQLQEFGEYAASFPKKSGFSYIPPDLHPKIKQTLNAIPKNLLKANPEMKSAVKSINAILKRSAERMSEKGIALGLIAVTALALMPNQVSNAQISSSRTQIKRALIQAKGNGPEALTLAALALSEHNETAVADILLEDSRKGNSLYPIISAEIDLITAPTTVNELKEIAKETREQELKNDFIDMLSSAEPLNIGFNFSEAAGSVQRK